MSDLFKDHKPELSDDEDRRLWQRVRAIPGEAEGASFRPARTPWWRALWAMPSVRYGAPGFAVLVAAVIWVAERAPAPTLKVESRSQEAPTTAPPPAARDAPLPQANPAPTRERASAAPSAATTGTGVAAQKTESRSESKDQLAGATEEAVREDEHATGVAAGEDAQAMKQKATFAQPPAATPRDSPPRPNPADRLEGGSLPDPAALRGHPLLRSAVGAAAVAGDVPFPRGVGEGDRQTAAIEVPAAGPIEARVATSPEAGLEKSLPAGGHDVSYGSFEDAPPRLQAAVLAFALERALADPKAVSRDRIGEMLRRAREVARRSGGSERPGAERLVRMLEGAHRAWPTR